MTEETRLLVRRVTVSAGAGAVLGTAWVGLAELLTRGGLDHVVLIVLALYAVRIVLAVLAWPLLSLLRVRPAGIVALLAPVILIGFISLYSRADLRFGGDPELAGQVATIVIAALAYAVAALVSAPGLADRRRLLIGLLVIVAILFPWIAFG